MCIETTGASSEILDNLLPLDRDGGILLVRIQASLETCLRIANRDPTQQISLDRDSITEVYRLSTSLDLPFDRVIQNEQATEQEIAQVFSEAPATSD